MAGWHWQHGKKEKAHCYNTAEAKTAVLIAFAKMQLIFLALLQPGEHFYANVRTKASL